MGLGRGRAVVAGAFGALALVAGGCGAETHSNEQRPEVSLRVSVTIGPDGVTVQPTEVATGPARTQQIPQNQNQAQPPIRSSKGPLNIVFVAANQTRSDTRLEIRGPRDVTTEEILATSPGTVQTELPTGSYTIAATALSGGQTGRLTVGPYRASSQNDVLLP